jgi:protein-S-isoprenylcysteine O-methyltransferase Ste14
MHRVATTEERMASRTRAILGSAVFLVIAPGTLAGLVPWWISRWALQSPFTGYGPIRALGVVCIAFGLPVLLDSFARFALQGRGTPAPPAPTERLVVRGFYRFVRNPIYVAVTLLIAGQALLFGDWRLLAFAALFWLCCHLFVVAYEEPTLRQSFGGEYESYCAGVRRWLPRLTPWRGDMR